MSDLPHFPLFIDGQFCAGSAGQTLQTVNPATGAPWATFDCAAPGDVDRAVSAAARVLDDPVWRL